MALNAAATDCGEATSQPTAIARGPISAATFSTFATVRPSSTTSSPSAARRRASARPSPAPAPVITMVFDMNRSSSEPSPLAGIHGKIAGIGDAAAPERLTADLAEVMHRARKRAGCRARLHGNAARTLALSTRAEILDGEREIVGLLRTQDQLIAGTIAARLDLGGGEF